jgi:hypothetical protein
MGSILDTRTLEFDGAIMRQVIYLQTAMGVEVTTERLYTRIM